MLTKIKTPPEIADAVASPTTYLRHATAFDTSSIPTAPTSPPGSPVEGDIVVQTFDNLLGEERVVMRWEYQSSAWVQIGHVEYNKLDLTNTVASTLTVGALPSAPVGYTANLSTTYVPGDSLYQEYSNGYLKWTFNGTAWVLQASRVFNNQIKINLVASFDTASLPTAPSSTPSNPHNGDIVIDHYSNLTGDERVQKTWTYNGTAWVAASNFEYNTKVFSDVIVGDFDIGSVPSAPTGYTTSMSTSYIPGDTLTQEYDDGYVHWTFNGTTWDLDYAREMPSTGGGGGSGLSTFLRHGTTFDLTAIPTAPSSPPGSPVTGDVVIQYYDNLAGTERATIRWTYNGTTWTQSGHVAYHPLVFSDIIGDPLIIGDLPTEPVGFTTSLSTTYVPGDTLHQEYDDGYIHWTFDGTAWVLDYAREVTDTVSQELSTYFRHSTTLDVSALPTAPDTPPGSPISGDSVLQSFDNLTGTERALQKWVHNGTAWVESGHITYKTLVFSDTVADDLDLLDLPTAPVGFTTNLATSYVPGDTLHQEYDNGYLHWTFNGTAWVLDYSRVVPVDTDTNNKTTTGLVASFNAASVPTAPTVAPSSPVTGDVYIETFNNTTGNQRVVMRWTYNGSIWVLTGVPEYNTRHFTASVAANIDGGGLPSTPSVPGSSSDYVPGDTLWEEYTNGYILWTRGASSWTRNLWRIVPVDTDTNNKATLGVVASFNANSVPTAPTVAPSSPITGDVYIETFNNTKGTQRVTMRWTYNGSTWVLNGSPEYNTRVFTAVVISNLDDMDMPSAPGVPGAATDYVPGDTLWEDYLNGYVIWTRLSNSWSLERFRIIPYDENAVTSFGVVATFDAASVPTAPSSPPSALDGDTYIETFTNGTGTQRVIMRWTYNGSAWILNGVPEYNTRHFNAVVASTLIQVSPPSTPATPGASTDYVPGDTLWEEYTNGYILWTRTASSWTRNISREIPVDTDTNWKTTFQVPSADFNMNAVPTAPASPPSSPGTGDTVIELYKNTSANQKVLIFWTYNGSAWVMSSTPHYNNKMFFATVSSNLTAGSLPSTPATPGSSTGYVTGDTLHETFNNGTLDWRYGTSSWTLVGSMVNPTTTSYVKATGSWAESGTEPTSPSNAPSSPKIGDLLINVYDNGTRNNAVTKHWTYNGSAWVAVTNGTHRRINMFTNVPGTALTYGVAPTAANAATNTSYINGDILWEKHTNGYGLYKYSNGSWGILTYGLEVGRIQDSADFLATLGSGVDGWAVVYDHTAGGFTLADI